MGHPAMADAARARRGALILNVDDNEAGRYAKTRTLQRGGHRVAEAANGADALRLARELRPALILLDVRLPDISGFEVCQRLKAAQPETLVLHISATFGSAAARVQGLSGGADAYLTEPVEPAELLAVVDSLLRLRQAEDALRQLNAALEARVAERTAALAASEGRLRAWFEGAGDAAFVVGVTAEGRFPYVAVNPAAERLFGIPAARLLGRQIDEVAPAEVAGPVLARCRACLAAGAPIRHEQALPFPTGERVVDELLVPLREAGDAVGPVTSLIGIARDITEQRMIAARLAQAEKLEAIGRLAGGVAHDINNVLQAVEGGIRLMMRQPSDAAAVQRLGQLVLRAAERGGTVARRLLSVSRRGELRPEAIDLATLLAELRELLAHTLGPSIAISIAAEPDLPPALADRGQLETVLLNLAANARDAMPGGGPLRLAAGLVAGDDGTLQLCLRVSDAGTGMAPETLARATEPFFSTKPRGQGTGIGLAMAHAFAEESGGRLVIESLPGCGTTVSIRLPVAGPEAAPSRPGTRCGAAAPSLPASAPPPPPAGPGGRLLVVDDDASVRGVLASALHAAGHDAIEIEDAAAALRRLEEGAPCDLLVTDLVMPGMDGFALIRAARVLRPGLGALMVTGYAEQADLPGLAVARQGGPFVLAHKPLSPEALTAQVRRLLAILAETRGTGAAAARTSGGPPATEA